LTWLSDDAVARLRAVTDEPETAGTRYRIIRQLGRGGMGVVYEAEDRELERRVAFKVLASEATIVTERLRDEARIIARLEHPGIVPLHDAGVLSDGRVFYVMKLVRGRRLDQFAREQHAASERLRVFLRICEAVAFAHARGVVHCDLKPENVMLGELGEVLVMDWGIARSVGCPSGDRVIAGTRGFMAPEQERGEIESIDASTDVYALGAILRALLLNASKPLAAVIAKATSFDRARRYADAKEVADEITRYLDDAPLRAYRATPVERATKWLARNSALVTVVIAYLLMRVAFFLWMRR
jgi:serine/threonine protein kinase